MLFSLHADFENLTAAGWAAYEEDIHTLLEAHRRGDHVFLPTRKIMDALSQCAFLGGLGKATLSEIRNKYVELEALSERVLRVAVVYDPSVGQAKPTGNKFIGVEKQVLSHSQFLMPFHLIVESLETDGDFWELIFEVLAYAEFGNWGCPKISRYNGGGGTTGQVLLYHARRMEMVYCIVDSDRRSPFGPMGDTATNAKTGLVAEGFLGAVDNGLSSLALHVGLHVLNVREAENLIPLPILKEMLAEIGSANYTFVSRALPSEPANLTHQDQSYLAYYDMKQSTTITAPYHCPAEEQYFAVLTARVGQPLPGIRNGLLRDLVYFCGTRQSMRRKITLAKALAAGPFSDELSQIFWDIFSLACAPPSRWF